MSEHSCPNCGSDEAVSKSAAWDALTKTPPKAEKELAWLRSIADAARPIKQHWGDDTTAVISIPASVFENIRKALAQAPTPEDTP